MSPVCLNPGPSSFHVVELKEEQNLHLFLSPNQAATSLSSGPSVFDTAHVQRGSKVGDSHQHDQEVYKSKSNSRSSDHKLLSSSSFQSDTSNVYKFASCKREDGDSEGSGDGSVKWMPSKMRLMQKMMNSNCSSETQKPVKFTLKFQEQQYHNNETNSSNNSNSTARVCSDCNTTTTPLWRSGPRGPKSLCNACGIRQRKARRAMAAAVAAANGTATTAETSSMKTNKVHNKEKKPRTSHVSLCKKLCKPPDSPQAQKKLSFKNLALSLSKNSALQRMFPQDVEEAAILLMELSCGFIHS